MTNEKPTAEEKKCAPHDLHAYAFPCTCPQEKPECICLIPEDLQNGDIIVQSPDCPFHSQEKPEWGLNNLLDQSAKRFDEFMKGEGDGPTDIKAFLRSEQIAFALKVLENVIEAGAYPGTENLCLPQALGIKLHLTALQDTPNEPQ